MGENKRQFLGIWIPREIYLNKKLSWTDKILLVEINSLDNEKGCFASNDYFAEFLSVTKTTISISISKLKKLGFVKQVSFDGRTRVLKADFKDSKIQTLRKLKGRPQENLKHNNTDNKTINKKKKINKKEFLNLDKKEQKKINDIKNGSVCINVKDLINEKTWLEHCSRFLELNMYWTENLLKKFIQEQQLKDDAFKSIKETKNHFLNWSKIEVAKNRKFGNNSWGRNTPMTARPKPQKIEVKKEISDKEKKELHKTFMREQLINPYKLFCETGNLKINNFGGLVFNELKKFKLLFEDQQKVKEIKEKIKEQQNKRTNRRGQLRKAFKGNTHLIDLDVEIIKMSLTKLKKDNVDLEKRILM